MAPNESTSNKKFKETDNPDNEKSFTPREYQIEILEAAKKQNTIACLGTGTGKTFIAVMLIRENAYKVRKPYSEGGKRIFFLVPTVPLVIQQARTIEDHTDLKVKMYYGEMEVDSWNKCQWLEQFEQNEVLVMTAEIFRIIVDHAFIPLTQIQLLIIDECHRAQGDHPYRLALKCFVDLNTIEMPRVFGLSASLLNGKCKPTQLEKNLRDLELTLRSTIITASDIIDLQKYGTDPNEFIVLYNKYQAPVSSLFEETQEMINEHRKRIAVKKDNRKDNDPNFSVLDDINFFGKPIKCLNSLLTILDNLGLWCAHKAAEMYLNELESLLQRSAVEQYLTMLNEIRGFLVYFVTMCKSLEPDGISMNNLPKKLRQLLDIFYAAKRSPLFKDDSVLTITDVTFEEDPEGYYQVNKLKQEKSEEVHLCSLIFVEQRITAYVLQQWLLEIKKTVSGLEFLNPEFIVGHGTGTIKATSMSEKLQQKKLKDFRNKKCNVLVATQVLEEGMDIRQCNLVIRFDLPWDFRSYVQSKGRARAKNSIYVMLVEEGENYRKFIFDLTNFKTIEKMLLSKCHGRAQPDQDESSVHMADNEIPPYMPYGPNKARITMNSAISLINRYCSSLPTDMATKLVPQWTVEEVDPDVTKKEFICKLRMPINSPLRRTIISEARRRRKLAKMDAALKACQMLHKIGELNEDLVPISCLVNDAIINELGDIEEEDGQGAIPGTNRRRQIYEKRVAVFLKDSKPEPKKSCYLHILELDLVTPLSKSLNPRRRPIVNPADSPRGLALLSTVQLPPVNPFPIFNKSGKILVTVKTSERPIHLTDDEIRKIEEFHRFIFLDTLWLEENREFSPNSANASYYILPINKGKLHKYEIDWNFITATHLHSYNSEKFKTGATVAKTIFTEELFTDAVVLRSYKIDMWKIEKPTFHHVIKVLRNLSPESKLECNTKYKSFKEYYCDKYKVTIEDDSQPLIETVQSGGLHMWKPIYKSAKETFDDKAILSKSKQKHRDYREYLVPELCIIHPFPSSFFSKVMCLPTLLFRLNGLLLAEEIRQAVAREAFVGMVQLRNDFSWTKFNLETSDKELREYLYKTRELEREKTSNQLIPRDITKDANNDITSFESKIDLSVHTGPAPSLLLTALTVKGAGDEFDLERLEMIGDSFLKYAMSVKTYIKYPNFDEGRLTKVRMCLIQNLHLYQKAKKKGLGQYLTATCFNCSKTWLPPCYIAEDNIDQNNLIKKTKKQKNQPVEKEIEDVENPMHLYFTKQVISDKCVADSVEALIGSYLLSCGQQGALRFMAWFGLKPLVEDNFSESDFTNWPPSPPDPIVGDTSGVDLRLEYLTNGLDRFERIIKYKFKNRAYLLQAFTHPSYSYNNITDCYQRLEFLGDAVLDYLITRQLYEDPSGHSPGKLTDLRSALVNNIYFASLAVVNQYHEFLKMLSPSLFRQVNEYVSLLKESEAFKFFEIHGYVLQEIECFELDEVEVPKALGDVFESVAGAIYLDSDMSLDTVWSVLYPMIKPAMEHLCKHVPISPVRELYEYLKTKTVFGEPIQKQDKTYIEVILKDGRRFPGVGPNKKVAKRSAAKRALSELKGNEKMDTS